MSSDNDLCELVGRLKHADYEFRKAAEVAIRLMDHGPAGGGPGWPQMADLAGRIEAMRAALADLSGRANAIANALVDDKDYVARERDALRKVMIEASAAQWAKDREGAKPLEWNFDDV